LGILYRDWRGGVGGLLIFGLVVTLRVGGWAQTTSISPTQSSPATSPPESLSPQNSPAQNPSSAPQNPTPQSEPKLQTSSPQKKDDNPAEAAADKTKDLTIEAAEATKKLGEETFVRAREWEYDFITGPYVPRNAPLVSLTAHQRERIYLEQTLITPGPYLKRMFVAGIDQWREAPSQWGVGWGAYAERFASREGQFLTSNTLATLGNAALRYEPRYNECRCAGFKLRLRHAILRNFVTYDESERELHPQWALYGGAFAGGVISSTWKPHPRSPWADGGWAVLGQAGYGALLNFFTEFAGEINQKLGARRR
jgi:hypothetical protein